MVVSLDDQSARVVSNDDPTRPSLDLLSYITWVWGNPHGSIETEIHHVASPSFYLGTSVCKVHVCWIPREGAEEAEFQKQGSSTCGTCDVVLNDTLKSVY